MAYVIKDLNDEQDKNNNSGSVISSGVPPTAKSQGMASVVAPQQTAQQKRGTGFTNLSEWLNAGQGRDKQISSTGNQLLNNEKNTFGAASDKSEAGLASNKPLKLSGATQESLDKAAGIVAPVANHEQINTSPDEQQMSLPMGLRQNIGLSGALKAPGRPSGLIIPKPASSSNRAIDLNPVNPIMSSNGPLPASVRDGPTLEQVLGQTYNGPGNIDYKAGQDFQDAKMLGNTGTVSDVLARDAISKGQYTQGMRSLDNVLFGSDSASQNAIKSNSEGAGAFQNDASNKGADFEQRAQSRANEISDAAGKTRSELQKIGDDTKSTLQARAEAANQLAQSHSNNQSMIMDPSTGKMVPIPKGYHMGGWEGDAVGSANSGNVMTDAESKRFSALNKYLGYDAPTKNGSYNEGRNTAVQDVQEIKPGFSNEQMKRAKEIMVKEALQKSKNKGMVPSAVLATIFGGGIPAAFMAGDAAKAGLDIEHMKNEFSPAEWEELTGLVKKRWGTDDTGNVAGWNLDQNGNVII